MRNTITPIAALLMLLAMFMAGCTGENSPAASPTPVPIELEQGACLAPLEWGMTMEEAKTALQGYTVNEVLGGRKDAQELVSLNFEATVFGKPAEVGLSFRDEVWVDPAWRGGKLLTTAAIRFSLADMDRETLIEQVSAVLGERETQQIGYQTVGSVEDGDFEERISRDTALEEGRRYWHAEQNLLDLFGEERMAELAATYIAAGGQTRREMTTLARFYNSWLYVVTIDVCDAEGKVVDSDKAEKLTEGYITVFLEGYGQVVADAIEQLDDAE